MRRDKFKNNKKNSICAGRLCIGSDIKYNLVSGALSSGRLFVCVHLCKSNFEVNRFQLDEFSSETNSVTANF